MEEAKDKKPNPVRDKSFAFALRIIKLYKYLTIEKQEYVMSKYMLNAGTNIGAMLNRPNNRLTDSTFSAKWVQPCKMPLEPNTG